MKTFEYETRSGYKITVRACKENQPRRVAAKTITLQNGLRPVTKKGESNE